ncbi:MAG TPA: hypothetical protein VNM70_10535, partial [Burkholderiales bacterium]|nr:hypothetical protein [Burkholderiales bacterium]
ERSAGVSGLAERSLGLGDVQATRSVVIIASAAIILNEVFCILSFAFPHLSRIAVIRSSYVQRTGENNSATVLPVRVSVRAMWRFAL